MSTGMQFPVEAVRQHAAVVSEVAEQMAVARSAVREVSMDRQAYGEICQFLPGLLEPLFAGAVEVLIRCGGRLVGDGAQAQCHSGDDRSH